MYEIAITETDSEIKTNVGADLDPSKMRRGMQAIAEEMIIKNGEAEKNSKKKNLVQLLNQCHRTRRAMAIVETRNHQHPTDLLQR